MREKLIELQKTVKDCPLLFELETPCSVCEWFEDGEYCNLGRVADHLIANGVTVQKKGEWKWEYIVTHGVAEKKAVCSLCGVPNKQYKPPYCPHCGAKMDAPKDGDT